MLLTRRSLVAAFAMSLALSAAPARAQDAPGVTADAVTLGSWTALTGQFALYGQQGIAGINAYFGLVNDNGGINGRQIKIINEDHGYNPQQAVAAARKLVESDQVLAIHAAYGTAIGAATFPYLTQQGVPFVMPYAGAPDWYEPVRPLVIGGQTLLDYQSRALGRWAGKEGAKKIAVVHAALAVYERWAQATEEGAKHFSQDIEVQLMPVKIGTADYAPIALEIAAQKPDAIVFNSTIQELSLLAKELEKQGLKIPLYTTGGNVTNDLITLGGSAVEGLRSMAMTRPVDADTPELQEFRDAMAKYSPSEKPDYGALLTFALSKVTAEAIRQAPEPLNRESLVAGFEKLKDFDTGIIGKITITPEQHMGTADVIPVEIRDGKWVSLGEFVDASSDW